eukprot:431770_1
MGSRTSKGRVPESEMGAGGSNEGQQATDGAITGGGGGGEGVNNPSIAVTTSSMALGNSTEGTGDSGMAGTSLLPRNVSNRRRRVSVSAEVDKDVVNVRGVKKFVPKSEDTVKEIEKSLQGIFLFASLSDEQMEEVVGAMEEKEYGPGDNIIMEDDDGHYFYIVAVGSCDVYIKTKNDGKVPVRTLQVGDSFGELALMYNAPRSATVRAGDGGPVKVWALDRSTFRSTILASGQARRKKYEEFLEKIPLLNGLIHGEIAQLADAVEPLTFDDGEKVIEQGQSDRINFKFYFIECGQALAFVNQDGEEVLMNKLGEGDYFGEKALVEHTPRTATVKANQRLKCATLSIATFERLMGPCEDLLKERASTAYPTVEDVKCGRFSPKDPTVQAK